MTTRPKKRPARARKPQHTRTPGRDPDTLFRAAPRRDVPFAFVLDELASLDIRTRPMFGCLAIYVGEVIVLILRDRDSSPRDNGVWVATTGEHHASLLKELPSLRPIEVFEGKITAWQNIPSTDAAFEEQALRACELVRARDPRIGKIPKAKRPKPVRAANSAARKPSKPKKISPTRRKQ